MPFILFFPHLQSPWYNRTGWLGIKHQFTYLLPHLQTCLFLSDAQYNSFFFLNNTIGADIGPVAFFMPILCCYLICLGSVYAC